MHYCTTTIKLLCHTTFDANSISLLLLFSIQTFLNPSLLSSHGIRTSFKVMTTIPSHGSSKNLRREHIRFSVEEKEFDEEIDFGAARREKSLAMDSLETLGTTAPSLVTTLSSSSPKCIKSPRSPTAHRERSLPLETLQPIESEHAEFPNHQDGKRGDLRFSDTKSPEASNDLKRKTKSFGIGVFAGTYTSGSGQSSDSSCNAMLDTPTRRVSTFAISYKKENNILARATTMRLKNNVCKAGSPSLLRRSSKMTPCGQDLVRKAGVFDCPCDAEIALRDLRTILERSFRSSFLQGQHNHELRARVCLDTGKQFRRTVLSNPKRKRHCSIIVQAMDLQGFSRLCIRRTAADAFLVDDETFDALCTQMFYKLSEVRQVTRPYFI